VKYTDFDEEILRNGRKATVVLEYGLCYSSRSLCSSAGKTELPVDKYRIPAMIYSPGFIQPQRYTKLMSQIDIMPTLLVY
jgi:hypothetical protein